MQFDVPIKLVVKQASGHRLQW